MLIQILWPWPDSACFELGFDRLALVGWPCFGLVKITAKKPSCRYDQPTTHSQPASMSVHSLIMEAKR